MKMQKNVMFNLFSISDFFIVQLPLALWGSTLFVGSQHFPQILDQEWKWLPLRNTLAYYETESITVAKSFRLQVPVLTQIPVFCPKLVKTKNALEPML